MKLDGDFYKTFSQNVTRYSADDCRCIEAVTRKLASGATSEEHPGMLLGKIQSGKTKTFLAVMALAFDNGYDVAVILTKGTKALARQTYERISSEFAEHEENDHVRIFDIMTLPALTGYELSKKIVLVVKKQSDNLDRLIAFFGGKYPQMAGKRVLIIDDEADFASVGFHKEKGEIAANVTTQKLESLRKQATHSSFLQVTATPYSLYLQPGNMKVAGQEFKPVRPSFTELVPVHADYIGGEYYFDDDEEDGSIAKYLFHPVSIEEIAALKKKDGRKVKLTEVLTSNGIPVLRHAICNFIVGGCIRRLQDAKAGIPEKKFSFLVHTEAGKASHEWQEQIVEAIKQQLARAVTEDEAFLHQLIEASYTDLSVSIEAQQNYMPPLAEVVTEVTKSLQEDWLMITKVNSEKQIDELLDKQGQLKLRNPLNIFIGGQILDRGITIANMIGFFYGRRPNVFQQDTVLQHSRMYGFRPKADLAVTRFYTEQTIYNAMKRMHESDVALRDLIQQDPNAAVVFIQKAVNGSVIPCSPNKIALSNTTTLKPWKRILPVGFQTVAKTYLKPVTDALDKALEALAPNGDFEAPYKITLNEALDLLSQIEPTIEMEEDEGFTFDWEGARASLTYLAGLPKDPVSKGSVWCLVRKDRNLNRTVSAGSHALYADAPDSTKTEGKIRKQFAIDSPMLILIRQNGREEQEWRGAPFYWPVISAQQNTPTAIFAHELLSE